MSTKLVLLTTVPLDERVLALAEKVTSSDGLNDAFAEIAERVPGLARAISREVDRGVGRVARNFGHLTDTEMLNLEFELQAMAAYVYTLLRIAERYATAQRLDARMAA